MQLPSGASSQPASFNLQTVSFFCKDMIKTHSAMCMFNDFGLFNLGPALALDGSYLGSYTAFVPYLLEWVLININ